VGALDLCATFVSSLHKPPETDYLARVNLAGSDVGVDGKE
jgi:hypothetical protein